MSSIPPDTAAEVEKLEELHRQHPEGRYFVPLADRYRKLSMVDQAEELLREGLRKHPDYLSAHVVLGGCLADRSALEEAADEFRYVLSQDPQNLIALRTLGELAAQGGRGAEAERWYQELLSVDPMNKEARQALEALSGDPSESAAVASGELAGSGAVAAADEPDELQDWGSVLLDEPTPAGSEAEEAGFDASSFGTVTFTTAGGDGGPAESEMGRADDLDLDLDLAELDGVTEAASAELAPDDGGWTLLDFGGDERAADEVSLASEGEEEVVTETIADLYARQGLHERATGVYRELIRRRGGDAGLEAKLEASERAARGEVVPEVEHTGEDDFLTLDDEFVAGGSSEPELETAGFGDLDLDVTDRVADLDESDFATSEAGSERDAADAFAASFANGFEGFAGNDEQAPEDDLLGATPNDAVGEPDSAAAHASPNTSATASDASPPAIREWFADLLDWRPGVVRVAAVEGGAPAADEPWAETRSAPYRDDPEAFEPLAIGDEVETEMSAAPPPEVPTEQPEEEEEDLSWLTDILDEGTAPALDEHSAAPPPPAPPPSREVAEEGAAGDEDLASFQAWLQSLKR